MIKIEEYQQKERAKGRAQLAVNYINWLIIAPL